MQAIVGGQVERLDRGDAPQHGLRRREMRDAGGILLRQPVLAVGQPCGGIQEQRLRRDIGGDAGVQQQAFAGGEAAQRVRMGLAPGVDQHQPVQQRRPVKRQLQPDQSAKRMADEMAFRRHASSSSSAATSSAMSAME